MAIFTGKINFFMAIFKFANCKRLPGQVTLIYWAKNRDTVGNHDITPM